VTLTSTPSRRRRFSSRLGTFFFKWVVFAAFVAVWQLATSLADQVYFPTPLQIVEQMHALWLSGPPEHLFLTENVGDHIVPSLLRLLGGWALAGVIGIVVGLVLGRSDTLYDYFSPTISFLRSIPPPAMIPVFLVLFTIGTPMQLATIVFGVVWPVLLNTIDGAHTLDQTVVDTTRSMRLSRSRFLATVVFPAALPKIFAGLRVSLSLALILMVISELVGTTNGIGYQMINAQYNFSLPEMWAGIVLLGILGYVLNVLLLVVQNRVIGWHAGSKSLTGR
jgi:ABC-type nitrate/sulfonate/bicarbonate transport system permease component